MDILLLEVVVAELQERFVGARFAKIHQPTSDTLVMRLWNGRENQRLLISVGQYPRLHLTESSYPNPFTPPRFCQLLRSRLSRLEAIHQIPGERMACLACSGEKGGFNLYLELFGNQGNLLLVDDQGVIVDALVRRKQDRDGRELLPGKAYRLPKPLERISLHDQLPELPAEVSDPEEFRKWLQKTVTPMSPAQAKAMAWQVGQGSDAGLVLEDFRQALLDKQSSPALLEVDGESLLVVYPPAGLKVDNPKHTLSELLDNTYYPLQFQGGRIGDRGELQKILNKEQKRLQKRLENIAREGDDKEDFDDRRQLGDLLLANLHQVKKGMESVRVPDYSQNPVVEVSIPLDPRLTPQDNAQALFKRYKKEKRGLDHIERRSTETREELAWLEQLQHSLDEAETPEDLFEIAEELKQAGLYRERSSEPASRKKVPTTPKLNQATSPNGFAILWGRNNRSNDYLTTRAAAPHDYWFHAHRCPGCHLVLKRDSASVEVSEQDLLFAASIAAGYSRRQHDRSVDVVCCQVKDVYKVKGAHPGQVNLRQFDTLTVDPVRMDESSANP